MPLYRYVKAQPNTSQKTSRNLSALLILLGTSVLLWTFWPIISFSIFTDPLFAQIVSPVTEDTFGLSPVVLASAQQSTSPDASTNANTWFPTSPQKKVVSPVNAYSLSIPKLKISDATVVIGGDDLSKSLIHYGGTGLPGKYGNAVIFGHSTLPQFYNPTDYKTIFSTLPTMKIGDDIFIQFDGIEYRYVVYNMVVTDPADLSPLEQRFDDSYITLITCVPPGTTWKRLNVKARLVRISS